MTIGALEVQFYSKERPLSQAHCVLHVEMLLSIDFL